MDEFNHNKQQAPFNHSSIINTMNRTFSEFDFEDIFKQSIGIIDDDDHRTHPAGAGGMFSVADGVIIGDDDRKNFSASCSPDVAAAVPYRNMVCLIDYNNILGN